jgi:hypothetical protein
MKDLRQDSPRQQQPERLDEQRQTPYPVDPQEQSRSSDRRAKERWEGEGGALHPFTYSTK